MQCMLIDKVHTFLEGFVICQMEMSAVGVPLVLSVSVLPDSLFFWCLSRTEAATHLASSRSPTLQAASKQRSCMTLFRWVLKALYH